MKKYSSNQFFIDPELCFYACVLESPNKKLERKTGTRWRHIAPFSVVFHHSA